MASRNHKKTLSLLNKWLQSNGIMLISIIAFYQQNAVELVDSQRVTAKL